MEDIKDGYYYEPDEILSVEDCRVNINKVIGGFIPLHKSGIILNENSPVEIVELKYRNKKYRFWYTIMRRNENIGYYDYI